MASRISIYHPAGRLELGANVFGKDVANQQLFRALAEHGGFESLDLLANEAVTGDELARDMGPRAAAATQLRPGLILNQQIPAAAGALLRGQPALHDLAWLRRRSVGDRAYSLLGLVHTTAPAAMRQFIAMNMVGPTHPWDAVICTSPSVQAGLGEMLDEWADHLAHRTAGSRPPAPQLPLIPLGVDGSAFAALADRPRARARLRSELGLAEADILILWVGRLSYFEKAFPQPMFAAAQLAAENAGVKVHFALCGWFPNAGDPAAFRAAADLYSPDVSTHFLDGNDRAVVGEAWAAADIFISLVDNVQETFGITPIEAMAAGLPVVVSDWDGYRSTVRHGVEGFLIPTLGGPAGPIGETLALRHAMEIDTYQFHVGSVAQHTAVHIGRAGEALAALARSPDLRRRMGEAGRARIASTFDWPVVARQYRALVDELGAIRAAAPDPPMRHRMNPVKTDPFQAFANFATQTLTHDTVLRPAPGATQEHVRRTQGLALDRVFGQWRATTDECAQAFAIIEQASAVTVHDVVNAFPAGRRLMVRMGLAWMAKLGFIDWLDPAA